MIPMSNVQLNETHPAMRQREVPVPCSAHTLEEAAAGPGAIARRKGDVIRAMVAAGKTHSATYFHQPSYVGRMWASVDRAGLPIAWRHRIASIVPIHGADRPLDCEIRAVEGAANIPYAIPNVLIEHVGAQPPGLDGRFWDDAGLAENAFTVESFVDELAALAGSCPARYRRGMLADSPRALAVLELAISRSDWNLPRVRGIGRGLAMLAPRSSFLALVAEVEVSGHKVRVTRVTCATECGPAFDSRTARRHVETGILDGLCLASQDEAPALDVHFIDGPGDVDGIAQSASTAIAPAVANAIFITTGNRIRALPIIATPKELS